MSVPAIPIRTNKTLPMSVDNMTFMIDRMGKDCSPLQYIRELTQNAIEAILSLPQQSGEIRWDVDWNFYAQTGCYKLCVIDTGVGMTGEEMVKYINQLSSSIHKQSTQGNYGIGAKIAALPCNHAGLVYFSWKDGIGYTIHLWRDPETDQYGLRKFEHPDGTAEYWAQVDDSIKPDPIKDHGTMVVLLGCDDDANTMSPPAGTPMASRWILRYLNSRYYRFPAGIEVKAREGWELPRNDTRHNFLRNVTGQGPWLDKNSCARGTVELADAKAHWWIVSKQVDADSGHYATVGHIAALFQNRPDHRVWELYEMQTGRSGVARLQAFGVIFGHNRVVIYVEPTNDHHNRIESDTARTRLMLNGEPLPWTDWSAEFREKMPDEISKLVDEVGAGANSTDHRGSIWERLKQIRDLFRFSRYRPSANGRFTIDAENRAGGRAPKRNEENGNQEGLEPGPGKKRRRGRASDIYSLFLASQGTLAEELRRSLEPDRKWITAEAGTRTPPDLDDRAARYLPDQHLLLINGDFRVFTDMIHRWIKRYSHAPGAGRYVEEIVREWFEQQLVEVVLGALALRRSGPWTLEDMKHLWSEEALSAAVLPRYHIDIAIKRALGAKLGTLKERSTLPSN